MRNIYRILLVNNPRKIRGLINLKLHANNIINRYIRV